MNENVKRERHGFNRIVFADGHVETIDLCKVLSEVSRNLYMLTSGSITYIYMVQSKNPIERIADNLGWLRVLQDWPGKPSNIGRLVVKGIKRTQCINGDAIEDTYEVANIVGLYFEEDCEQLHSWLPNLISVLVVNGMTLKDLSRESGISVRRLIGYMSGEIKPRHCSLRRIANAVHVKPEMLTDESPIGRELCMLKSISRFNTPLYRTMYSIIKDGGSR